MTNPSQPLILTNKSIFKSPNSYNNFLSHKLSFLTAWSIKDSKVHIWLQCHLRRRKKRMMIRRRRRRRRRKRRRRRRRRRKMKVEEEEGEKGGGERKKKRFFFFSFPRWPVVSQSPTPPNLEGQSTVFITPGQDGPAIHPGTRYPFQSPFTTCMGCSATILFLGHHTGTVQSL
jgi:hypothetical protein